jgi:hypothetical protein
MEITNKLIYSKLSAVMKDIGPVTKQGTNITQKYKFRGIDQMINALHPALVRHGVVLTTQVVERTEQIREVTRSSGQQGVDKHVAVKVIYTFYAEDGSCLSSVAVGEGLDSGDKATNKAMSAAFKYALIQTFAVPTEDMEEADLASPEIGVTKAATQATQSSAPVIQETFNQAKKSTKAVKPKGENGSKTTPETKPEVLDGWE